MTSYVKDKPGMMAPAGGPSYSRGGDRKIILGKSVRSYLKNKLKIKELGV
jgi:uncharacterized protein YdiU (UPF0061 family)